MLAFEVSIQAYKLRKDKTLAFATKWKHVGVLVHCLVDIVTFRITNILQCCHIAVPVLQSTFDCKNRQEECYQL